MNENILLQETNRGGYTLSIVARFEKGSPVQYKIRVSKPRGAPVDFVSTLEGFKNIGELLVALYDFAQTKLYPKDPDELRKVLTAEYIKKSAPLFRVGKFGK